MNNPQTRIDGNCDINNEGNLNCSGILITVEVDGEKPTGGNITFTDGKVTSSNIILREENGDSPKPQVPVNNCTYNGDLIVGSTYTTNQYIYRYKRVYYMGDNFMDLPEDGWSVKVKDPNSTAPITEKLCTTINDEPIVNMVMMFMDSQAQELDLSSFDTSNVTDMSYMFTASSVENLNLSSFDTSKVTSMFAMFSGVKATTLNLSSFDTSKVTNMGSMFSTSSIPILNLNSFDTSSVINMNCMFCDASTTTGYAKTPEDAARFNASYGIPSELTFIVKPAN